jgi:hypothetical protein
LIDLAGFRNFWMHNDFLTSSPTFMYRNPKAALYVWLLHFEVPLHNISKFSYFLTRYPIYPVYKEGK